MEVEENMNKSIESGDELPYTMEINKTLNDIEETDLNVLNNVAAIEMDVETDLDNNNNSNNKLVEENEVRSEATFQFEVEEFSKLKDQVLSPPCYVRNLPWKIMAMPRTTGQSNNSAEKFLGFYLQCNGESDATNWSCKASAHLRLLNYKPNVEPFSRNINHIFFSKENDWGFSHFMAWNEVLDPEKGYIKNDKIILEVHVQAEAPHGVFWDSKKYTGFVGLKNQGATCYMNSLLQTLYFTNYLRKAVYRMPTEADDSSKSVALALQRVFHELQFNDRPVGTKKLTKSFGWETLDSFMQHDVQEFLRVLLDKLESKMKGTCIEGTIPRLFEGKMSSYIQCKNVNYTSTRIETFYDIQLNIKGKKNIYESFEDYVAKELLDGDNKYDAGEHGLQDAEKGVIFVSFPPVLHLHLMRFQYDPITDNSVKFNDRFEFNSHINLDKFLKKPSAEDVARSDQKAEDQGEANYTLHAVLVHSGDNHGGHYVVYINPQGNGKWCKFDDDVVSRCNEQEAIEQNFGGGGTGMMNKHCSNAYMLVYIRDSKLSEILQNISEDDIPVELSERLQEEKRMELVKRRERAEANNYMTVNVVLEEYFEFHQTVDLFDLDKIQFRVFKVRRTLYLAEFLNTLMDTFKLANTDSFRIWKLVQRNLSMQFPGGGGGGGNVNMNNAGGGNNTCNSDTNNINITRPVYLDIKEDECTSLYTLSENTSWFIFLEMSSGSPQPSLKPFNKETDVMLFFKCYDPRQKRLNYVGLDYFHLKTTVAAIIPELNRKMGWPESTELTLYQEQGTKLLNPAETLEQALKPNCIDGEIVIFETLLPDSVKQELDLPTVQDYFQDLMCRVEVTFLDKTNPNDTGFTLELSYTMKYQQWTNAVGQRMNVDPNQIQFSKCQHYKDSPGNTIPYNQPGELKDILLFNKPKQPRKVFYQILTMKIDELENKKQFKCTWVPISLKEEKDIVLYPNKGGTVRNLLDEARRQVELCPELGSGQLRIVEVTANKLTMGPSEDFPLQSLSGDHAISNTKLYRIEEIPKDELNLEPDELLVPVSHFHKDVYNAFGIPFLLKIKNGETYGSIKERIKARLGVPDKEWEKYKFALIPGPTPKADAVPNDEDCVNIMDFKNGPTKLSFGLEHVNKSQKRSRFNYLEKAIKIYN